MENRGGADVRALESENRNGKFPLFSFQYFSKKLSKRNDCGSDGEEIFYSYGEKCHSSSELQYCLSYANRISEI